jgi:hypothetical protein
MACAVGSAVIPPDRSALAQRNLGGIKGSTPGSQLFGIVLSGTDRPSGVHQFAPESLTEMRRKIWIASAPEAAANDDVEVGRCLKQRTACHDAYPA